MILRVHQLHFNALYIIPPRHTIPQHTHTAMASVLHSTLALSPNPTSRTTSASLFTASHLSRNQKLIHNFSSLHHRENCNVNRGVVCQSSEGEVDLLPDFGDSTRTLKNKLMIAVSGLNRGLAANEDDIRKAEAAAKELESAGGPVDLSKDKLEKLQGQWKLIYSSAFSGRTLGGSRPGPPIGRLLPITLGQVFQRIDVYSKDFDNIVELQLGAPWPLPPLEATATLAHKFEIIGTCGIKITFEKTTVKTKGNLSQLPPLDIPRIPDALRQSSNTGSGEFEVTYLDSDTRVTRGDRGELRVFVIS